MTGDKAFIFARVKGSDLPGQFIETAVGHRFKAPDSDDIITQVQTENGAWLLFRNATFRGHEQGIVDLTLDVEMPFESRKLLLECHADLGRSAGRMARAMDDMRRVSNFMNSLSSVKIEDHAPIRLALAEMRDAAVEALDCLTDLELAEFAVTEARDSTPR